jgi:hypothetical protein
MFVNAQEHIPNDVCNEAVYSNDKAHLKTSVRLYREGNSYWCCCSIQKTYAVLLPFRFAIRFYALLL